MKIRRISITDKYLGEVEISFRSYQDAISNWFLITGKNGSGKSTVLNSIVAAHSFGAYGADMGGFYPRTVSKISAEFEVGSEIASVVITGDKGREKGEMNPTIRAVSPNLLTKVSVFGYEPGMQGVAYYGWNRTLWGSQNKSGGSGVGSFMPIFSDYNLVGMKGLIILVDDFDCALDKENVDACGIHMLQNFIQENQVILTGKSSGLRSLFPKSDTKVLPGGVQIIRFLSKEQEAESGPSPSKKH